jgi:hypothetical protein
MMGSCWIVRSLLLAHLSLSRTADAFVAQQAPKAGRRLPQAVIGRHTSRSTGRHLSISTGKPSLLVALQSKKAGKRSDDDDDTEDDDPLGMEAAFQKLHGLQESLDAAATSSSELASTESTAESTAEAPSNLPLEKEVEIYKNLVVELESKEDVYTNVLADMSSGPTSSSSSNSASSIDSLFDDPVTQKALASALQEVSNKDPSMASSALNDQEIMKEIKVIMERGNAELLASLEVIREEQVRKEARGPWHAFCRLAVVNGMSCPLACVSRPFSFLSSVPTRRLRRPTVPDNKQTTGRKNRHNAWLGPRRPSRLGCSESKTSKRLWRRRWLIWSRRKRTSIRTCLPNFVREDSPSKWPWWALFSLVSEPWRIRLAPPLSPNS